MQRNSVIVAAKRTPIGAFQGQFSSLSASDLGASVIKQVLIDAKIQPDQIDEVIMGNVLSACLLYTSPSPRDYAASRMPSSA